MLVRFFYFDAEHLDNAIVNKPLTAPDRRNLVVAAVLLTDKAGFRTFGASLKTFSFSIIRNHLLLLIIITKHN